MLCSIASPKKDKILSHVILFLDNKIFVLIIFIIDPSLFF